MLKCMKKMTFLVCAAICTCALVLSSCQSKGDEPVKKAEVVKTQFSIALPNQLQSGANRMPSAIVQNAGMTDFQGLTGITLIPFANTDAIESTDARLGANITTANSTAMTVAKSEIQDHPSKAKVFNDVSIPLTTGSFLFYAKSAAAASSVAEKFNAGSLIAAGMDANTPAGITFSLEQICPAASSLTTGESKGAKLIAYLTSVATADDAGTKWYETTDPSMLAMFNTFTSMKGLSSFEVARVLTDLNKSLKPIDGSNSLAHAIRLAIANATYAGVNASDEVVLNANCSNFPQENNLPEGSINIKWSDGSHAFIVGDYANMATPDKYVYPAQLWYYVNSTIKTSNTSKQTMYDDTNDWATILGAHTDAVAVNSLTRAVAIKDPVQYAVARLDVAVRLAAAELADNSELAVGVATPVNCSAGFPVSAILVGGQQQVKFDFTTNGGTEYTIYDKVMASEAAATPATMLAPVQPDYSAVNHTLVLENGTSDVMIAVELTNTTGVDFYGAGNQLIPKDGKFYVIAKLGAAAATGTGGHVFKQDFKTTANLTLQNLKNAYNTIPDLRTPQLELGFSVDLTWQAGTEYNINFE